MSGKKRLQHYFNAMHVYCRLRSFLPRRMAIAITKAYENLVHPILYR